MNNDKDCRVGQLTIAYHSHSHHLQYGYHSLDVFSDEVTNSLRENKQVRVWQRNGIGWRLNYMKMVEVFFLLNHDPICQRMSARSYHS